MKTILFIFGFLFGFVSGYGTFLGIALKKDVESKIEYFQNAQYFKQVKVSENESEK